MMRVEFELPCIDLLQNYVFLTITYMLKRFSFSLVQGHIIFYVFEIFKM